MDSRTVETLQDVIAHMKIYGHPDKPAFSVTVTRHEWDWMLESLAEVEKDLIWLYRDWEARYGV